MCPRYESTCYGHVGVQLAMNLRVIYTTTHPPTPTAELALAARPYSPHPSFRYGPSSQPFCSPGEQPSLDDDLTQHGVWFEQGRSQSALLALPLPSCMGGGRACQQSNWLVAHIISEVGYVDKNRWRGISSNGKGNLSLFNSESYAPSCS